MLLVEWGTTAERQPSHCLQVVDRPTQGHRFMSREYVQPQWVIDSANFRVLARTELYVPGIAPPPHLSPFAAAGEDEYVPDYLQTMRKLQVSCASGWGLAARVLCGKRWWQVVRARSKVANLQTTRKLKVHLAGGRLL